MNLVDIGANLTHESFSADLDNVVDASIEAGLCHIILTGTDLESTQRAIELCKHRPQLFSATAGFHPHVAASCSSKELSLISELAASEQVVAVGETGLDFNRNFSPKKEQLAVFEKHLELAVELQKPVFLHQRDAHEDFLSLLKRYRARLPGGVVHCFTDTEKALEDYLELDMHIGVTGWICDERRGKTLQQLIGRIPADRLLIETDAPYLLPRSLQEKPKSRRNEPKYLVEVLNTVSQHCGRNAESVAAQTASNAAQLFNLKLPSV